MKTTFMLLFFFICDISMVIMAAIMPFITRKTESFGVSIPEEVHEYPEVKELRKSYRNKILLAGGALALGVLAAILISSSDAVFLAIPSSMLVILALMYAFYMSGHKKMKELKLKGCWTAGKTQMVVVDTAFRSKRFTASPLWFTLFGAIIFTTAITGIAFYDKIPARIPMHWNIEGIADNWADKSYKTIMWAPFAQLFITFVMMLSYWIIGKSKQLVDPSNPEKSSERNRIFRYRWSVFIIITGLAILIMFLILELFTFSFLKNIWLLLGVTSSIPLGILIGSITLAVKTGQGGSRLSIKEAKSEDSKESKVVTRDADNYWKAGLFYYNPDDPSLFVEKRFGVGWTVNFGRPGGWLMLIGILGAIAAFAIVSAFMAK